MAVTRTGKQAAWKNANKMSDKMAGYIMLARAGVKKPGLKGGKKSKVSLAAQSLAKKAMNALASSSKKKSARYVTTGVYRGLTPKPSQYVPSLAARHGASVDIENGGVSESPDCTYIGHAMCYDSLVKQVARSIVRRLFLQIRQCPRSWTEQIRPNDGGAAKNVCEVRIYYQTNVHLVLGTLSSAFQNIDTMDTIADWVVTSLKFTTNTDEMRMFRSIQLDTTNTAGDLSLPLALLNFQDLDVHMGVKSALALQNRTLGAVATDNSKDDVTNNPLEGKSYGGSGNGSHMHIMDSSSNLATNHFFGSRDKGLIAFDPTDTTVTAGMKAVLRRPPTGNAFVKKVSVGTVRLGPGNIKKSVWHFGRKMRFGAWQKALHNYFFFNGANQVCIVPFGKFEFFGFEKLCRTGVGSSPVSVGYELNQTIGAYCTLVRRGIPRDQVVLT